MISPDDALREFIKGYYYGSIGGDIVAEDANALIEWMRERGWHFDRAPQLVGDIDGR